MLSRRSFLLSASAVAGFQAASFCAAAAQPFADGKPITLVVPFAAGGGSDILARIVAQPLSDVLKAPVVIENRPGAGGILATRLVKDARPDGTTLLLVDMGFSAGASLDRQARYHPTQDFEPIASIASVSSILTVKKGSIYASLADLVTAAKQRPGALNMASGGTGGTAHLIGAMFAEQAGFTPTHIPYRGMNPAMTDVLAGQTDFLIATAPVALPYLRDGRITALAVASEKPIELLPDLKTFAQQGYPGVIADNVYGLVAPAGLPNSLRTILHREVSAIVQTDAFANRLAPLAATPRPTDTPQAYTAFLESDFAKWREVIQRNNIAP
jgi:tripartite-type tricarboxylate transporter receptor subunit TctC